MKREHLIENGYKEWKKGEFQKLVRNPDGSKKYFINVSMLSFTEDDYRPSLSESWTHFTPSMQCSLPDGRSVSIEAVQWYNTNPLISNDHNIAEVEEFFAKAFIALGFINYED